MENTLKKIKLKGHWKVVIRPFPYNQNRISDIEDLEGIIQRTSVKLRGWDFPHVDRNQNPGIGVDYIEQDIDWREIKEFWRFYQSGQFIYYGAYRLDWTESTEGWTEQPHKPPWTQPLLSLEDIVCCFAEFMEFASALSLSEAGSSQVGIGITATALRGRELWMSSSRQSSIWDPSKAQIDDFPQQKNIFRDDLVARTRSIGLDWANELLKRFGLNLQIAILEEIRNEFR